MEDVQNELNYSKSMINLQIKIIDNNKTGNVKKL